MDPSERASVLAAIAVARRLLAEAAGDARTLDLEVAVIARATDWQARATDGYRGGVAELGAGTRQLVRLIDAFDDELRSLDAAEAVALTG